MADVGGWLRDLQLPLLVRATPATLGGLLSGELPLLLVGLDPTPAPGGGGASPPSLPSPPGAAEGGGAAAEWGDGDGWDAEAVLREVAAEFARRVARHQSAPANPEPGRLMGP